MGQDFALREREPGSSRWLARLSPRVAVHGFAAAPIACLLLRRAGGDAGLWIRRLHGTRALSCLACPGPSLERPRRAALANPRKAPLLVTLLAADRTLDASHEVFALTPVEDAS